MHRASFAVATAAFADIPVRIHVHLSTAAGRTTAVANAASPGGAAATVVFHASSHRIGWNTLNVTTNADFSDLDQAYSAGFGEGAATYDSTWNNFLNTVGSAADPLQSANVTNFVTQNWAWMKSQVAENSLNSNYWAQVGLQVRQFEGLLDGLNSVAPANQTFSFLMLQALNLAGDLIDLVPALDLQTRKPFAEMTKEQMRQYFVTRTHCSALVKLALDLSDIFFGHATWSSYNTMLRTYKHYNLNYASAASKQISFSGYPGTLASVDDYYVTDTGLSIIETTVDIMNQSIYDGNVVPQSVLYWVRVMVASRMAATGEQWTQLFAEYNSGTYNNQWLVLDLKLFNPGEPLVPKTFFIAEQIPGMVGIRDRTTTLQYGYWPSYNLFSIPEIAAAAGYVNASANFGPEMFDYSTCVRAQIFRRDQSNVFDMPAFMQIMQYNAYRTDPISKGDPYYAIASRLDLEPASNNPQCFGAIDAKVSSWSMYFTGRESMAYCGPTPQQTTFELNNATSALGGCSPFNGIPDKFNFLWVHFKPVE